MRNSQTELAKFLFHFESKNDTKLEALTFGILSLIFLLIRNSETRKTRKNHKIRKQFKFGKNQTNLFQNRMNQIKHSTKLFWKISKNIFVFLT